METLEFQFVTEDKFANWDSALIRWRTNCEYSHVDIVQKDGLLLGARLRGGVQERKPDYLPFSKKLRISVPASGAQAVLGYGWLYNQIGKPYDWKAIAGLEFHRNWRDDDAWFCSELAFAFAEKCGVIDFSTDIPDVKLNWLSPRDLILVLASLKKTGRWK